MNTGELATKIRALRAETIAAVEQRDLLGVNARRAVIEALRDGLVCRRGADNALSGWGLEPLPGALTVSAEGWLSYVRMHTDEAEAREQGGTHVPDDLYRILPAVWFAVVRVVEVACVDGEDGDGESHLYRLTVKVIVWVGVTASTVSGAISRAYVKVDTGLYDLAQAGITLTGLMWSVVDWRQDAAVSAVRLPDLGDDLAQVTAARDQALDALEVLRRKIRARLISALVEDELGGNYELTAARVERFLLDLGLAALPRAHHTTVVASLNVRVWAATSQQARMAVRDTMQAVTTSPHDSRSWIARGWAAANGTDLGNGRWQVTWWHVYEMWQRGHTDPASASTAGEALARADLAAAVAGVEFDALTVTSTDEGYDIDQLLDPDTD
jgi:hypothetical protein